MDLIVVGGGLGNQMSQFAFYYCKKLMQQDAKLFLNPQIVNDHNGYELNSIFRFNYAYPEPLERIFHAVIYYILASRRQGLHMQILRLLPSLMDWHLFLEPTDYSYSQALFMSAPLNRLLIGGWHSYQYYKSFKAQLVQLYEFPSDRIPSSIKRWLSSLPQNQQIVGIHVRKGDYLSPANLEKFGSVCGDAYYRTALRHLRHIVPNPLLVLFTNDLKWCNTYLSDFEFILPPALPPSLSWVDMHLMQQCDSLILSNSTFSWWAAFLSSKAKLVLRPNEFISGVKSDSFFPPEWLPIS